MAQLFSRSDLVNQGRLADHHVHEIIFARNTDEVTRILHDVSDPLSKNCPVAVATSPCILQGQSTMYQLEAQWYVRTLLLIITPTATSNTVNSPSKITLHSTFCNFFIYLFFIVTLIIEIFQF
jgi:hypothetical protein